MGRGHDSESAFSGESSAPLLADAPPTPEQGADTLSEVLREVRLAGSVFFLVDAYTPWVAAAPSSQTLLPAVLPQAQHLISYHVIRQGQCWCRMAGEAPSLLRAGDVLVVPHGDPYSLSSDPALESDWSIDTTLTWFRDMAQGRAPLDAAHPSAQF